MMHQPEVDEDEDAGDWRFLDKSAIEKLICEARSKSKEVDSATL